MRLNAPTGYKRVCDWLNKRVRSRVELGNSLGRMPAGTIWTVVGAGGTGLHLQAETPCACCGFALRISKVPDEAVELVVDEPAAEAARELEASPA